MLNFNCVLSLTRFIIKSEYRFFVTFFLKYLFMKLVIRLLLNAIAVVVLAKLLKGIHVDNYTTAVVVAVVLSILNLIVKPILVLFTLPITFLTLGLFLVVINALMILLADKLIDGFVVSNFWWAILFSILLSILQSLLQSFLKSDKKKK